MRPPQNQPHPEQALRKLRKACALVLVICLVVGGFLLQLLMRNDLTLLLHSLLRPPTMLVAPWDIALLTSMVVSTVVVWRLAFVGLSSPRHSTHLFQILVGSVVTVVLPGMAWYMARQVAPWTEWNMPLPPLQFAVVVVVLSGCIIFLAVTTLRERVPVQVPRVWMHRPS
ncbi:MAG TPA: hypothetical protein VF040_09355 [Ktedonobacterales bacterium]